MKASAVKRSAPANFAALSQRFRDRLYLVCVLRALRGILSNLSKAEEALRTRLVGRGSDPPEQVERRLAVAREELAARDEFDHVVVNDDLDQAVHDLAELVATIWGP